MNLGMNLGESFFFFFFSNCTLLIVVFVVVFVPFFFYSLFSGSGIEPGNSLYHAISKAERTPADQMYVRIDIAAYLDEHWYDDIPFTASNKMGLKGKKWCDLAPTNTSKFLVINNIIANNCYGMFFFLYIMNMTCIMCL